MQGAYYSLGRNTVRPDAFALRVAGRQKLARIRRVIDGGPELAVGMQLTVSQSSLITSKNDEI